MVLGGFSNLALPRGGICLVWVVCDFGYVFHVG